MQLNHNFSGLFPENYIQLFEFTEKEDGMPANTTLNRWLWLFGAFCKYNGIWMACKIVRWTIEEKPATVMPYLNMGTDISEMIQNMNMNEIPVGKLEALYTALPLGIPITTYIEKYASRETKTYQIMDSAITRSLETALIQTKPRFGSKIKKALDSIRKGEWFVIESDTGLSISGDLMKVVNLPNTANLLDQLQNSHDWSHQILLTKLGFSFNPEKRERLIQSELLVQTQEIRANRIMLTSLLIEQSEQYRNFKIEHIVDYMDRLMLDNASADINSNGRVDDEMGINEDLSVTTSNPSPKVSVALSKTI